MPFALENRPAPDNRRRLCPAKGAGKITTRFLLSTNSFWEVAPLMSTRYLGIPIVAPVDNCKEVGPGCVACLCVRGCVEPKLQGMTSQCSGTGLISCRTLRTVRTELLRTARYQVDVVTNLPNCPVEVLKLKRYRYWLLCRRPYRY